MGALVRCQPSAKTAGLHPSRPSYIPLQTDLFCKEKESLGKGFGIQGKVNQMKSCSILPSVDLDSLSVSWAVGVTCVLGAQWLRFHLQACSPPRHKGGTACGLPESGWVMPSFLKR